MDSRLLNVMRPDRKIRPLLLTDLCSRTRGCSENLRKAWALAPRLGPSRAIHVINSNQLQ
jgi:hypothetical protein